MKRHEQWFKDTWTEPRPEPLVMTDTEILDWMDEYCDKAEPLSGPNRWSVLVGNVWINGKSFRETASMAAAYHQDINR